LQAVCDLRARGVSQPMLMMSYLNPLFAYGPDQFVQDAKSAGADGLIIPDLPPEESALFAEPCARAGLALVAFLAPTSSDARISLVAQRATGFIYIVSLTGVTGARSALPAELAAFIGRVRQHTDQRLVVGFGISTREQVSQMDSLADGFIVGSALVKAAAHGTDKVRTHARALRE
jgi:tryptophan synthase alpha chain